MIATFAYVALLAAQLGTGCVTYSTQVHAYVEAPCGETAFPGKPTVSVRQPCAMPSGFESPRSRRRDKVATISALIFGIASVASSLLGLYSLKSIQYGPYVWRWVFMLFGSLIGFIYCLFMFLNAIVE